MFDISELAIIIIETEKDKKLIPGVLEDIKLSLFSQEPTFVVVSGEGKGAHLSEALNNGIQYAIQAGCKYIFWAHPDMTFKQRNWHLPLIEMLDTKPRVLKACACNSRDLIEPGVRLDQEQSWMMRAVDYEEMPDLWFSDEFKRIGGFEDWYQSWKIITSGYLVVVTSASQVHHAGMGTRKLRDTVQEQQDNSVVYTKLTGQTENPHQWKFFGADLPLEEQAKAITEVQEQFPQFIEKMIDTVYTLH